MAAHPVFLPGQAMNKKPGDLWSMGSQGVDDWSNSVQLPMVQMGLMPAHVNCSSSECLALLYTTSFDHSLLL